MNQYTIKREFELVGQEPYGGNNVKVHFLPAGPDSGIVFTTKDGNVSASLGNASQYKFSVLLKEGAAGVLHVEHLLATLYAYGIDNLRVNIERQPSRSFSLLEYMGASAFCEVVPNFEGKTYGLCEKLDDNAEQQDASRTVLTLDRQVGDLAKDRLTFEPFREHGLYIEATTDYPILGRQIVGINLDSETYKKEIARSRPYAKHVAKLPSQLLSLLAAIANPSFGIGHGFDPDTNVLLPIYLQKDMKRGQSLYPEGDEPARHTIMDRLGALALLPGRLDGVKVTARFSGHANDIAVLNRIVSRFFYS
ncbi:MAG: UDP-3-O-acyl-N-acetylglucosamine deacetylase [Nanoarchaeota archaeon]|nr:UDP-3-O-acyl-N-acetylglucosamine deacetylase [Nanoarchaeota archaeon]MBU1704959.1 UDP-3-O-acyl-N-acetylglucosamine deacetylase [Nanoarchaeota archaeon]